MLIDFVRNLINLETEIDQKLKPNLPSQHKTLKHCFAIILLNIAAILLLEVNQEECEDSDVKLDMLLDGLTKTSLHDHSTFSEDNYAMNINVHLDPSIISVQRPKIIGFRTLDESAGLLSPIKITHRSALGTMMSDKTRLKPTLFKHNSSNLQFQRFLFDTPSPHD